MRANKLEVAKTGDDALDEILGGGIPLRSVIVIAGEPGSGKTVMTMQMLFAAARRAQNTLYFTTLSEPAIKVVRYAQQFEFFDTELFEKHIQLHDLGGVLREGAEKTMLEIEAQVAKHEPAFVVIDSFKVLGELLRDGVKGRPLVYDLAVQMASWGATTFLVGEYSRTEHSSFAEFAIADGIIQLGTARQELQSVREIEVMKLRGAAHRSGTHFFDVTHEGLEFFPRVAIPGGIQDQPAAAVTERVRTGVEGLDELLDGGLPRTSTTVVQGGTGTGKTLLGLQFLIEGARRKEKGVLFTLEETPAQLRASASSLGWDLAALEAEGLLVIKYTSPVELSTDRYLNEARAEVKALGATRAVFDSLTTMSVGISSERRFRELVYAIIDDYVDVRNTLETALEVLGFQSCACSSSSALQVAGTFRPELVLIDLAPYAAELLTTLRTMLQPFVAIGMTDDADRQGDEELGLACTLMKPFEVSELQTLLHAHAPAGKLLS
ncbi:MAG: DUF2075 domain-containing protein [Deltaproteobacteria bacterium]|nr:DUF2075 domain-containing protein [Deltaproteobacteria bacterium]